MAIFSLQNQENTGYRPPERVSYSPCYSSRTRCASDRIEQASQRNGCDGRQYELPHVILRRTSFASPHAMRHATGHGRRRAPGQSTSLGYKRGSFYCRDGGPRENTSAIASAWSRAIACGVRRDTASTGLPMSGGAAACAGAWKWNKHSEHNASLP